MSKRQMRSMLKSMAGGGPVELTSPLASVKKLARLAFVAQQFGYEYADAGHGGSQGNALKLLIVPDPSPQARARAAQNWAQYPNAHDGSSLPPLVPDAFELLQDPHHLRPDRQAGREADGVRRAGRDRRLRGPRDTARRHGRRLRRRRRRLGRPHGRLRRRFRRQPAS